MNMIETVLFDLSEVYLTGMKGVEKEIARAVGIDEETVWRQLNGERDIKVIALFQGCISEAEYWNSIMEQHNYPPRVGEQPTMTFLESAMRRNFMEIPGTKDAILAVKRRGYKIGLLSDHAREWVDYCEEQFPVGELFETRCYSFRIGATKRHEISFRYAMKMLGADPDTTLFIDDNSKNLAIAQNAGIRHVHMFTDASTLRSALPSYGITL